MSPLGGLLPLVLKLIPLGLICCILPHAAPTCDGHHRIRRSRSDPARPRRRDPKVPPGLAVAGTGDRLGGGRRVGWAVASGPPPGGGVRAGTRIRPSGPPPSQPAVHGVAREEVRVVVDQSRIASTVRLTLGEMSNTILPTASDLFDILQFRARERHRHRRGSRNAQSGCNRRAVSRLPAPGTGAIPASRYALLVDLHDHVAIAGKQRLSRAYLGT